MQKFFLLTLVALMTTSPAFAEEDAVAALEAEAANMNVTPPEKEATIHESINKKTYYRVNHYSPQKKKALVKFSEQLDKRYQRINKQEYQQPDPVDPDNDIDMKYFFKKDINTDIGGPGYISK